MEEGPSPSRDDAVATVAPVMFAEVALGLAAPTARMCRFPTRSVSALTMHSRHPTGRLQAAACGQEMAVVVGLP